MSIAWGTVPDWFAAIGTVGALGLTWRLLRKELHELRADQRERQERQARAVVVWWEDDAEERLVVHALNAADTPIYELQVSLTMRPDEMDDPGRIVLSKAVLPPRADISSSGIRLRDQPFVMPVEARFRDASGRYWRSRPDDGLLEQLPAREHAAKPTSRGGGAGDTAQVRRVRRARPE